MARSRFAARADTGRLTTDLTDYRNMTSTYRIALKSLAQCYVELHDGIADLDAMISDIVEDLAPDPGDGIRSATAAPRSCC